MPEQISVLVDQFNAALTGQLPDAEDWKTELIEDALELENLARVEDGQGDPANRAKSLVFKCSTNDVTTAVMADEFGQKSLAHRLLGFAPHQDRDAPMSVLEQKCVIAFVAAALPAMVLPADDAAQIPLSDFAVFRFSNTHMPEAGKLHLLINRRKSVGENNSQQTDDSGAPFDHKSLTASPLRPILEQAPVDLQHVLIGGGTNLGVVAQLKTGDQICLGLIDDLRCKLSTEDVSIGEVVVIWGSDKAQNGKARNGLGMQSASTVEAHHD
jgi:hypothetical protein